MKEKRLIALIVVLLTSTLACNTLFPNLPQNSDSDAGKDIPRRSGECTDQRFKDAEQAAFQTMLQERADATEAFEKTITQIELDYKDRLKKQRSDYNKTLNACKDVACSEGAKQDYDKFVGLEQIDQEAKIQIAEDAEQTAIEGAQAKYNQAVDDARRRYCAASYSATGQAGEATFSGVICNLEMPFTLDVTAPWWGNVKFEFTPSSPTSGTWAFHWQANSVTGIGNGNYTVSGLESDSPRIVVHSGTTTGISPVGTITGTTGEMVINLVALQTNECN